jgi:hypothetical protein
MLEFLASNWDKLWTLLLRPALACAWRWWKGRARGKPKPIGRLPAALVLELASVLPPEMAGSHAWNPYPPLPRETVRDLLGIVRAMYRANVASDPRDVVRLQTLTEIGRDLRASLADARGTHPGTLKHIEAWIAAERAMRRLGDLVAGDTPATEVTALVRAVAARMKRES